MRPKRVTAETPEAIVRRAARGDSTAFRAMYDRYASGVYALACRMLGDVEEARDALQAVFITVHEHLASFREEASFSTWIYRIAYNECANRLRKRRRRAPYEASWTGTVVDEDGRMMMAGRASGRPDYLDRELREAIDRGLSQIPPDLRATFLLRDMHGLSYREIADAVGCSIGTVGSRLARARLRLAEYLSRQGIDETYFEG